VKTKIYKPKKITDDKVEILSLDEEELSWEKHTIRSTKNIMDRMLAMANNVVLMNYRDNVYVFAEVEAPGLRAVIGEGSVPGIETILSPRPIEVTEILFAKKKNDEVEIIHKIVPEHDTWIYEGSVNVTDLDFDIIILKSVNMTRVVLKEELHLPLRKSVEKKTKSRKRRKRKKKKTEKSLKKKTKKKTRKKKKRRRRKKK